MKVACVGSFQHISHILGHWPAIRNWFKMLMMLKRGKLYFAWTGAVMAPRN